jgi:hypothetical protein
MILSSILASPLLEGTHVGLRTAVERGSSEGARFGSAGPTWVFSRSAYFSHLSLGEWLRLPSTARIGRAQFHRARSASNEGTWPLPGLS